MGLASISRFERGECFWFYWSIAFDAWWEDTSSYQNSVNIAAILIKWSLEHWLKASLAWRDTSASMNGCLESTSLCTVHHCQLNYSTQFEAPAIGFEYNIYILCHLVSFVFQNSLLKKCEYPSFMTLIECPIRKYIRK